MRLNLVELDGSIVNEKYFAIKVIMDTQEFILRMPEYQYTHLKNKGFDFNKILNEICVKTNEITNGTIV